MHRFSRYKGWYRLGSAFGTSAAVNAPQVRRSFTLSNIYTGYCPGFVPTAGRDDLVLTQKQEKWPDHRWAYCLNVPLENGELDFQCSRGGYGRIAAVLQQGIGLGAQVVVLDNEAPVGHRSLLCSIDPPSTLSCTEFSSPANTYDLSPSNPYGYIGEPSGVSLSSTGPSEIYWSYKKYANINGIDGSFCRTHLTVAPRKCPDGTDIGLTAMVCLIDGSNTCKYLYSDAFYGATDHDVKTSVEILPGLSADQRAYKTLFMTLTEIWSPALAVRLIGRASICHPRYLTASTLRLCMVLSISAPCRRSLIGARSCTPVRRKLRLQQEAVYG